MYKLVNSISDVKIVQRMLDGAFIPFDENNLDYKLYLEWLAEGNEPLPAD